MTPSYHDAVPFLNFVEQTQVGSNCVTQALQPIVKKDSFTKPLALKLY